MRVKILCADGTHYVRTFRDGSLDAVASQAGIWEVFECEEFADGRFSLRTLAQHPLPNQYVRAEGGGGNTLTADRSDARNHEKFTKVALADGKVAIRTHSGNFWRAKNQGGSDLDCHAVAQHAWEIFTIQVI